MSANTRSAGGSPITLESLPQAILHIDADAFFTSVEQALHPELRGKALVTGKERGIVACASYEAKALGVKRPMRLFEARKIYPALICLPSDYETYSLYSRRMFSIIRRFTPTVEEYSIDEAFADISGLRRLYRTNYGEIASRIKQTIQKELGLTVSVGLSLTKSLAKIASKENKPDGLCIVKGYELHEFLKDKPLERVCGFGPNSVAFLAKKNIRTILDFIRAPEAAARQWLGKIGAELWHELRGEMIHKVETLEKRDHASISKTKTFTPPSSERDFVKAQLIRNLESAFIKLRRHRLRAKRLTVILRAQDYRSWGMEGDLDRSTSSLMEVTTLVTRLFDKLFSPDTLYRLTGIVLSVIEGDETVQYSLFDDVPRLEAFRAVDKAIDSAGELYGKHTLHLGRGLWLGKHRQHVTERGDLPERKKDLLKGETFRQRLAIPVWGINPK